MIRLTDLQRTDDLQIALLAVLCFIIAAVQVRYVGDTTIYDEARIDTRQMMHGRILHNDAPEGGWDSIGANGVNTRVAVVVLAELIVRVTGVDVPTTYIALDLAFIFGALLVLGLFLKSYFALPEAVGAVAFVGCILPMTFAYHVFHPWDRPALMVWILAIWAVRHEKLVLCMLLMAIGIAIKWDMIVLPGLYFLAHVTRTNIVAVVLRCVLIGAVGLAVYAAILYWQPAGHEQRDIVKYVTNNFVVALWLGPFYPPFLAFCLPVLLSLYGLARADRFAIAAFAFGMFLLVPAFLLSHFVEVRAQIVALVLTLPCALYGLRRLLAFAKVPVAAGD